MVSSVLHGDRAAYVKIAIMCAFIRLREAMASSKELARRLDELEKGNRLPFPGKAHGLWAEITIAKSGEGEVYVSHYVPTPWGILGRSWKRSGCFCDPFVLHFSQVLEEVQDE